MTDLARIYGRSLYGLAGEEGLTEPIMEQMMQVRRIFRENSEYVPLLLEPSLSRREREDLLDKAFGREIQPYLLNFLKLLCEKNILGEYSACCREYKRLYYQDNGIAEAKVTSASMPNEQQKKALKDRLEKISGKKIVLVWKKDSSVLAGLQVDIEGRRLDGTIKGRLELLSRELKGDGKEIP